MSKTISPETSIEPGQLRIRDLDFEINSASIQESLNDGKTRWNLSVETSEKSLFGSSWSPNIRGSDAAIAAPSFDQIVGKTISVPLAYNDDTDEYFFSMYIFQHDDIFNSLITFLEQKESRFLIHWKGLCHVNWDEKYGRDTPFELKAWFKIGDN